VKGKIRKDQQRREKIKEGRIEEWDEEDKMGKMGNIYNVL